MSADKPEARRRWLALLIIAILLPGNFYLAHRLLQSHWPDNGEGGEPVLHHPTYRALVAEYAELNKRLAGRRVVVFIGDSITRRFALDEYFPDRGLVNRGIYSDTTKGLLHRLETSLGGLDIDKLFIMIGHNDLDLRTDQEIIDNIMRIVGRAKAREVYVQSILPVAAGPGSVNSRNARIKRINTALRKMCAVKGCHYVDLHKGFRARGGWLAPGLSLDGVHPNGRGYQLWSQLIAPFLGSAGQPAQPPK